jgi:pimeloyl-ACP methyl ester carboxylesterase
MNFQTKKCRWNTYTVPLSWVLIGLTTFSSFHAEAQTVAPTFSDVAYGPKEQQVLDFWKADSQTPAPLIMDIHGGGWRHGPKKPLGRDQYFLDRGISVAHITYRFTPANQLPVPVMDAARALQFLRSKAVEWNIDPARVIVTGHSAGGCTALWLATHDDLANPDSSDPVERQSTRVMGAVVASAQTTIEPGNVRDWVGEKALGHPMICNAGGFLSNEDLFKAISKKKQVAQLYREFSPANHLSPDDPPMVLEYGKLAADRQGDIHDGAFGVKFKERADALGVQACDLKIADHKDEYPGFPGGKKAFIEKIFN